MGGARRDTPTNLLKSCPIYISLIKERFENKPFRSYPRFHKDRVNTFKFKNCDVCLKIIEHLFLK